MTGSREGTSRSSNRAATYEQCCRVGVGSRSRRFLRGVGVKVEKRILAESESKIYARLPTSSVAQKSD